MFNSPLLNQRLDCSLMMAMRRVLIISVLFAPFFAVFGPQPCCLADTWAYPKPRTFYSSSRSYYLEMVPRAINSPPDYFEEKTQQKKPTDIRPSWGTLYRSGSAGIPAAKVWSAPLSNPVAPVDVLVSDDGHVVTLDDWHNVGYGENVVVLYDSKGQVQRKFSLADLASADEIERMMHTASSIWWRGKTNLDDATSTLSIQLLLDASGPQPAAGTRSREIRISLSEGKVV